VTRYLLDARRMEHPEPLERSIAILRELDEGGYLYMLHRKEPAPLLALAREHRLRYLSRQTAEDEWHILITPNADADLESLMEDARETA